MSAVLRVRGATLEFAPGAGVLGIDLEVVAAEVHALVGLNGAGKSTLMRLALGMLHPSSGRIEVLGAPLSSATSTTWARVGHLVDRPLAYGELTVRENLDVVARLHGLAPSRTRQVVADALGEFGLEPYADRRFRTLSSGNAQRVGLAGALLHHPELVVLDEPTNALDPAGVLLLREVLLARMRAGAGVLVSSHHLDEVARVGTRVSLVNRGRVIGALDPTGVDLEREFFARLLDDDRVRGVA